MMNLLSLEALDELASDSLLFANHLYRPDHGSLSTTLQQQPTCPKDPFQLRTEESLLERRSWRDHGPSGDDFCTWYS